MSERKVLNKYYPPDFDPSKIPKLRTPKNRTFSIRIMAPFNMRCNVCGEYIYKGKKFNSRKENVDDDDYLGLRIFRFYIRCPKCVAEIAFKTDLRNTDYTLEAGATRLFEAEKLAQEMAEKERKEKEEEELNPMKVLENRTKASRNEMDQLDELEELREINARHAKVDTDCLIEKQQLYEEHLLRLQQEQEDELVRSILAKRKGGTVKRLADSDSDEERNEEPAVKKPTKPTDVLVTEEQSDGQASAAQPPQSAEVWRKSVGSFSSKVKMAGLVKKKPIAKNGDTNKTKDRDVPRDSEEASTAGDIKPSTSSDRDKIGTSSDRGKISTPAAEPHSGTVTSNSLCLLSMYGDVSSESNSD